jgi:hypothetical protein
MAVDGSGWADARIIAPRTAVDLAPGASANLILRQSAAPIHDEDFP